MNAVRFDDAAGFRRWLGKEHASSSEIVLRLRKAGACIKGVTYPEALDSALCFGWIDGVRRPGDADTYLVRFSPRKARSVWSKVNLAHYARLEKAGLVAAAGRAAFDRRDPARSGIYSFESLPKEIPAAFRQRFEAQPKAWSFFLAQPPGYRKVCLHWVLSAKKEDTRLRRLARLMADSAAGRRLGMLAKGSG